MEDKMKKFWTISAIIVVAIFIITTLGCKQVPKEIKIGAVLPLTGDVAVWGNNTKEGIDLAVERINATGSVDGKKIKIIYEDSEAKPEKGVTAINKLITVDRAPALIDNSISSVTLAMAPIAEKNHMVILATGATAPKITDAGDYIFRIWNSDAEEGAVTAKYVYEKLGLKKAAVLYVNNDYGKGLNEVFNKEFSGKGGEILISQPFEQSETDFRTQLTKIKKVNPDAIYLVGYPREVPQCLKQMKELGLNVKVLSTVAFEDPNIIKIAKSAAEGVIYPFPVTPTEEDSAVRIFLTAYRSKYSKEPGITCDVGYDAVNMLALAIKLSSGYNGDDIQKGLMMIKNFHGASGIMEFDKNGDVHKPMGMKIVKDGKFVWYAK
jgi:branched-chain amino acid transport system substrate-binding protein